MWGLERALCEIGGFARVTLQPAAGAQGELCGLMMIRAYHADKGRRPTKVLIPDTAHGTNPASCTLNGCETVSLKTGADGLLSVEAVKQACAAHKGDVAAIMITNPTTLGLFEEQLGEIADVVHEAGGLVYMDGANLNALLGKVRPGDTGVDVMHINLHKTFTTPHGGGGPGSGSVGVVGQLEPYLPTPTVEKVGRQVSASSTTDPKSIGRLRSFFGNFGMFVRAYTYIRELGGPGLTLATEMAVLNANYIRAKLADVYSLAYDKPSMHEVVFTDKKLKSETGVQTLDVAKRLIDYGYHPPTIYFPLPAVTGGAGALMIEPTETETPETLDAFCDAMRAIAVEAKDDPEIAKNAPHRHGAAPARRDARRAQPQAALDSRPVAHDVRPLAEAGGGDAAATARRLAGSPGRRAPGLSARQERDGLLRRRRRSRARARAPGRRGAARRRRIGALRRVQRSRRRAGAQARRVHAPLRHGAGVERRRLSRPRRLSCTCRP